MPYKSEAQRKFFNSEAGKEKLGEAEVEHWNKESEGMKLQEVLNKCGLKYFMEIEEKILCDIEVSDTAKQALGLETDPTITHGRLNIKATKSGCAKITIHAIGSGDRLGDGTNIGGMEISRDISIISRPVKSSNGGWL